MCVTGSSRTCSARLWLQCPKITFQVGITGFRDVERPKAIVKTHIAWKDPNKKNLGEAIGAHFDNLIPACRSFLNWLNLLFGEQAQQLANPIPVSS